jgi:hypothetical protein
MASLYAASAIAAATHGDIETTYDSPPHNLFLILRFAAFRLHTPAAMRTVIRQGNRDAFIHPRRYGAARLSTVAAARFTARSLRIGFRPAPRMGRRLTLGSTQSCFQLPAQTFRFLFQALDLFAQPVVFLPRSIQLSFGNELDAFGVRVSRRPSRRSHPTLR